MLDPLRAPVRQGSGNVWLIPVVITAPTGATTTTVTLTFAASGLAYGGETTGGTATDTPIDISADIAGNRTFVDVAFTPGVGRDLVLGSIDGGEFALSGFGGSGVTVSSGPLKALHVGNNVFRFFLDGQFRPGDVVVTFTPGSWNDQARGPPVAGTPANRGFTQTFGVAGSTADLVRTVPITQAIVALGGSTIGRDALNTLGYLEITFRGSSGFGVDHSTINGGELELRDAAGNAIALSGTFTRVGLSDTYRYGLAGPLAAGAYSVTFVAGSFSDTNGVTNRAEVESFNLAVASADIVDPGQAAGHRPQGARGPRLDRRDLRPARRSRTSTRTRSRTPTPS